MHNLLKTAMTMHNLLIERTRIQRRPYAGSVADQRVLLLGGTGQGRELANALLGEGVAVISSLAGRTRNPIGLAGEVRVGGFGGVDGLVAWLAENPVDVVVNATHPFADEMSANAEAACGVMGVPLLRLTRPSWGEREDAQTWHWVDSHDEAAREASGLGSTTLLAVGRQSLGHYRHLPGTVVARVADATGLEVPAHWTVIEARGPFDWNSEAAFFAEHGFDVVVTKDSGGPETEAKLDVCAQKGLAVVMIARPDGHSPVETVHTVADAVAWVRDQVILSS